MLLVLLSHSKKIAFVFSVEVHFIFISVQRLLDNFLLSLQVNVSVDSCCGILFSIKIFNDT